MHDGKLLEEHQYLKSITNPLTFIFNRFNSFEKLEEAKNEIKNLINPICAYSDL